MGKSIYFISTWASSDGRVLRHVVGKKQEGDTKKDFILRRAPKVIRESPIDPKDMLAGYKPLLVDELVVDHHDIVQKNVPIKVDWYNKEEFKPKLSKELMVKYLKDNGYIVYKKHGKKDNISE